MNAVTLLKTNGNGVETVLEDVTWQTAILYLCERKLPKGIYYTIMDNDNEKIAVIIYSNNLQCSRNERAKRLHVALMQYDLNIERGEFCPMVQVVAPPKRAICENLVSALFVLCIFFLVLGLYA